MSEGTGTDGRTAERAGWKLQRKQRELRWGFGVNMHNSVATDSPSSKQQRCRKRRTGAHREMHSTDMDTHIQSRNIFEQARNKQI